MVTGLRPGGLLRQPRDVEVAVVRHQQRARDGRRRHHQHVGAAGAALRLQREPLVHAEAVLLVDDGEGQVAEGDVGLEQRVRADEDVDLAGREAARAAPCAACPSRAPSAGRCAARPPRPAARSSRDAGAPAPRSAPSARPARPPRRRSPSPSAPRPSCRSRRRPAAGAACAAAPPCRLRSRCMASRCERVSAKGSASAMRPRIGPSPAHAAAALRSCSSARTRASASWPASSSS